MRTFRQIIAVHIAGLALAMGCSSKTTPVVEAPKSIVLFATSELQGYMEPCGCTTNPLGDIARTAELVRADAKRQPVLYIDGGSTLFGPTRSEAAKNQDILKSETLTGILQKELGAAAVGIGPYDLTYGADKMRMPRLAANVKGANFSPFKVTKAGNHDIGILGLASPDLAALGLEVTDAQAAAKQAITTLQKKNVDLIVAIIHLPRPQAMSLIRATPGIDIALLAKGCPNDPAMAADMAQKLGDTWLVQPANRGQTLVRLELSLDGKGPLQDAVGKVAAEARVESLTQQIDDLRGQLAEWSKQADADKAFVARKQQELDGMLTERQSLREQPDRASPGRKWFKFEQIDIHKGLACDTDVLAAKRAYALAAGKANVAAAKGKKPPEPPAGQAGYVGVEACADCHDEAVDFWKKTKHAGAWETLEKDNKQFDYECISCHVVGWEKPGGSSMGHNNPFRDVQCETCHGPGSIHVEDSDPASINLNPPESLCVTCHNTEHSDTFDYKPYLRDVTGEGHAAAFRKSLGDGKTGAQLRAAGLAKAASKLGANCPK